MRARGKRRVNTIHRKASTHHTHHTHTHTHTHTTHTPHTPHTHTHTHTHTSHTHTHAHTHTTHTHTHTHTHTPHTPHTPHTLHTPHTPRYSPKKPSFRRTLKKQSKLFLYMISPGMVPRWFCSLVFTRSMGYTAVAPVAGEEGGRRER